MQTLSAVRDLFGDLFPVYLSFGFSVIIALGIYLIVSLLYWGFLTQTIINVKPLTYEEYQKKFPKSARHEAFTLGYSLHCAALSKVREDHEVVPSFAERNHLTLVGSFVLSFIILLIVTVRL